MNPYARAGRVRRMVDEDRLVVRYSRDYWSLSRCAQVFGLKSTKAVKAILVKHGVPVRENAATPDEDAVIRCYKRLGSSSAVATVFRIDRPKVVEILRKNGFEIKTGPEALKPFTEEARNPGRYRAPTPRDQTWKER